MRPSNSPPSRKDLNFNDSSPPRKPCVVTLCDTLNIIGTSPGLVSALNLAAAYARCSRTIMIHGETGVGKDNLAHLVHQASNLRDAPFERVNCSTITDDLGLSHLFGHVKGSFTGAFQDHAGIFERAEGGTIFFDEVGELPIRVQAMLLRVLQDGEYLRLGGTRVVRANVRIIAATNRKLSEMTAGREFRADLYHRLNVLHLTLLPLRERTGDLPLLIRHRLVALNQTEKLDRQMPPAADLNRLTNYPFPGNIRELFAILDRAYFDGGTGPLRITPESIGDYTAPADPDTEILTHAEQERQHILRVLDHCGWKVSGKGGAAEKLALKVSTLTAKMRKLGIVRR